MKRKILQNARFTEATEAALAAEYDVHRLWDEPDPATFLQEHGRDFTALVTSGIVGADAALLAQLPSLKLIASRGAGYDKVDVAQAKERGVAISYTPDVLTGCVADAAFGALIAVARRFGEAERFLRAGRWAQGRFPMGTRVNGKRLGIVGLGRIGRAVARRAAGFDMEVAYYGRRAQDDAPYAFASSLVELARWADFLVVTAAGGAATRHLVSAEVIAALGEQAFLINVARGSVVDEEALVAALDVFASEPRVPAALLALDHVVLLPHISSSTEESFAAMEELVLGNLRQFFRDGTLRTPV